MTRSVMLVLALAIGLGSLWALGGVLLAEEIGEDPALILLITLPVPMVVGMLIGLYVSIYMGWK